MRLILRVTNGKATVESADQSGTTMPADLSRDGTDLVLKIPSHGVTFTGKLSPDGQSIEGAWSQKGAAYPVHLHHVKSESELVRRRPQMPVRPLPYKEQDVTIPNTVQNVSLAGTLTTPAGPGAFPAVLLITGSQ